MLPTSRYRCCVAKCIYRKCRTCDDQNRPPMTWKVDPAHVRAGSWKRFEPLPRLHLRHVGSYADRSIVMSCGRAQADRVPSRYSDSAWSVRPVRQINPYCKLIALAAQQTLAGRRTVPEGFSPDPNLIPGPTPGSGLKVTR